MKRSRHSAIQRIGVMGKGVVALALVFLLGSCVMATAAPAQDSFTEGELAQMNDDLAWTRNLGDAFLFQEADVGDMIQELRQQAYDAGHLDGQENIRVVRDREARCLYPLFWHSMNWKDIRQPGGFVL